MGSSTEGGIRRWFCFRMSQKELIRGLARVSCMLDFSGQAARRPQAFKQFMAGGISQSGSLCLLFLIDQHSPPQGEVPHFWVSLPVLLGSCFRCQISHSVAWCFSQGQKHKKEAKLQQLSEKARAEGPTAQVGAWLIAEGPKEAHELVSHVVCRQPSPSNISCFCSLAQAISHKLLFFSAFPSHTNSSVIVQFLLFP